MQQLIRHRSAGVDTGFTLVEILFTLAVAVTAATVAIPSTRRAVDELRTVMAARYLAARLTQARVDAVARSACVGLRFVADGDDYRFVPYADGNGNGVRSIDIALGIDTALGAAEQLRDKFPGVSIGLMNGLPDADDEVGTGSDGVRVGTSHIETMSPDGTATAGTIYLHGPHTQYAVRILGTTGRVRVLQYRPDDGGWVTR